MKRIKAWIDENREKLCFSAGLNFLVLAGMLLLMRPMYDTGKDVYISALANGAMGGQDAHVIFQNYFLGKIYSILYTIFGVRFRWYAGFQYGLLFVSFTMLTYIILRKWKENRGIWISLIFLMFAGYACYVNVSYVKTASAAAAAGILLMLYGMRQKRICWFSVCGGILLAAAGSLYRCRAFVICLCMLAAVIIFQMAGRELPADANRKRRIVQLLAGMAVLLLVVGVGYAADRKVYQRDEAWAQYIKYNEVREELLQIGLPSYEKNKEIYKELGIGKAAYKLYSKGLFYDPEKLSRETMEKLLELSKSVSKKKSISVLLPDFLMDCVQSQMFYGFLLTVLFWVTCRNKKAIHWWSGSISLLLWFLLSYLLYAEGKEAGAGDMLCILGMLAFLEITPENGVIADKQSYVLLFLALLLTNQYVWNGSWRVNSGIEAATAVYKQQVMGSVAYDRDHLYLAMADTLDCREYGVFDRLPTGLMGNNVRLDGWEAATPVCKSIMEKYSVENPFRDVIGNDAVYLVDTNIKQTMDYIHAYYDEDAEAEVVNQIGEFKIYQIK